jgi:hypothetical protein
LENPEDDDVEFEVNLSNTRDFRVIPEQNEANRNDLFDVLQTSSKIAVSARRSAAVSIIFWPSRLGDNEPATIEFLNESMGSTIYNVIGVGLLPEIMEEKHIIAPMNLKVSSSVIFINPLVDPISVTVKLISEQLESSLDNPVSKSLNPKRQSSAKSASALSLLNQKSKYQIAPQGRLEIPIMYQPTSMSQTRSRLVIELSTQLKWIFPIQVSSIS